MKIKANSLVLAAAFLGTSDVLPIFGNTLQELDFKTRRGLKVCFLLAPLKLAYISMLFSCLIWLAFNASRKRKGFVVRTFRGVLLCRIPWLWWVNLGKSWVEVWCSVLWTKNSPLLHQHSSVKPSIYFISIPERKHGAGFSHSPVPHRTCCK